MPGFAVVLRIVLIGDKMALGEVASEGAIRQLDPPQGLWWRRPEESLREGHPFGPVQSGDCFSCFSRSPAEMSAKDLVSFTGGCPKDRKSCHVGGNAFVSFDGLEPIALCNLCLQEAMKPLFLWRGLLFAYLLGVLSLEFCEVLSVGARQRTCGCSPRGLGGVGTLVQGL